MAGPDPHDDTSAHYEQFEKEQLAQDRDAASIDTADVVTPVPEDQVLVHEPSGTAFDSTTQIAVFHRGWTASRDADAEAE
jgi:hypothetical protein